jgi:hypothetical protein
MDNPNWVFEVESVEENLSSRNNHSVATSFPLEKRCFDYGDPNEARITIHVRIENSEHGQDPKGPRTASTKAIRQTITLEVRRVSTIWSIKAIIFNYLGELSGYDPPCLALFTSQDKLELRVSYKFPITITTTNQKLHPKCQIQTILIQY